MEENLKESFVMNMQMLTALGDIKGLNELVDRIYEHGRLEGVISKNKEYCYHNLLTKKDEKN